jgi:hypothetical protein
MWRQFLRGGAIFAGLAAGSVALLCHCGGGGSGAGSPPAPGASSSWPDGQASGIMCAGPTDCVNFKSGQGQRPLCAAAGTCGPDHLCYFPSATGECLPPDFRFCDFTNGQYPACDQPDVGVWYPPNPAVCGLRKCVDSAPECYWSTDCSQPDPPPPVPALPPGAPPGLALAMAGAGWWMLRQRSRRGTTLRRLS